MQIRTRFCSRRSQTLRGHYQPFEHSIEARRFLPGRPFGYDLEAAREEFLGPVKGLLCEGHLAGLANQFPILLDVDIGHTTPMVTLPFGGLAILDSETNQFALLEAG